MIISDVTFLLGFVAQIWARVGIGIGIGLGIERICCLNLVSKDEMSYLLSCMVEMISLKKNKITLSDYDYRRDIENRLLMAQFSLRDVEVLEEILYSSLNISLRKLIKNLNSEEEEILPILEKFRKTGLLEIVGDTIQVDKEMRKYYESQILKFEDDFTPGMDFLQGLLRKPPIHVLPIWYNIPRSSNNIFDSVVEKCLLTPQIFQRYLNELKVSDPSLSAIIQELFSSSDFKLTSNYLIDKYQLSREQFEEMMLHLEFNFVCCLGYHRDGDRIQEIITPFHEWREYLRFLRDTEASPIADETQIRRRRPQNFSFIQDMAALLTWIKKQPLTLAAFGEKNWTLDKKALSALANKCEGMDENDPASSSYIYQLLSKLKTLQFVDAVDNRLYALESANDWLEMRLENRALFIYRHPLNQLHIDGSTSYFCTDRPVRESEKAIQRVLNVGWVYFDDFCKGILVPLTEDSLIMLKRFGKSWKYSLPKYSDEERMLVKATIFDWLFELGVVVTGSVNGRPCFAVTPFGHSLFGK